MPAKSRKQYAFMRAVSEGRIHAPGLTQAKAREFVQGVNYRKLPNRVSKSKH